MKTLGAVCAMALVLASCAEEPRVFQYRRVEQQELRVSNLLVLKKAELRCSPTVEIAVQLPGVGTQQLLACDPPDLELLPGEIESVRIHEWASLLKPEERYFSLSARPEPDAWRRFKQFASVRGAVAVAVTHGSQEGTFAQPLRWEQGVELALFSTRGAAESFASSIGQQPSFEPLDEERLAADLERFRRATRRAASAQ